MIKTMFGKIAIGQVFASYTTSNPRGRFVRLSGDEDYNVVCLDDGTRRQFHETTAVGVEDRRVRRDRRAEDQKLRQDLKDTERRLPPMPL